MNFGERLRIIRTERGLSQRQIAEALGVSVNSISQYENGKRFPDEKTIVGLCEFFKVSADYLFGLSDLQDIQIASETRASLTDDQKNALRTVMDLISKEI